jgi:hypothetical protein
VENAQVLSGFKASAPAEVYGQVMALIETQISSDELAEIKRLIG